MTTRWYTEAHLRLLPSGGHNAALGLLYKSAFGPRSRLSLRPWYRAKKKHV